VSFRLTRYGVREIVIGTVLVVCLWALVVWGLWGFWWWVAPLVVVLGLCWVWMLLFFRDPDRDIPRGEGLFVSPADGRVTDITNVGPESRLGCEGLRVGVFMSIFNVHVNRSPCDGRVEEVAYTRGAFLDARNPHASERNESAAIRMIHSHNGKEYPVLVRQIAGLVARRIVTDVSEGQVVSRGERIGMIKFGSRLELMLPRELVGDVRVRLGDRVRAGRSVLITCKKDEK